jgi:hypothetical protein
MKYKILKGSLLFDKFIELRERMNKVQKEATELVESLGHSRYCPALYKLAGGVSAIEFPNSEKVAGWMKLTNQNKRLHMPSKIKANEELLNKFKALPTLEFNELNDMINYDSKEAHNLVWSSHPGVIWKSDYVLIDVNENMKYTPVEGMIEILQSEYNDLKSAQVLVQ